MGDFHLNVQVVFHPEKMIKNNTLHVEYRAVNLITNLNKSPPK